MTEIIDRPVENQATNVTEQAIASTFLAWKPEDHRGITFEQAYRDHRVNYGKKSQIARALINSGQYSNPVRLVTDFLPKGIQLTPELTDMEQELKSLALIRSGSTLDTRSKDAQALQEGVNTFIEQHDVLHELQGMLPIHVMGAITSAFMFESVGDKEKLEELRKYTTKSLLRPYLGDIRYRRPQGQGAEVGKVLQMLPEQIFDDPNSATYGIVRNYIVNEAMRFFIGDEAEGFKKLEESIFEQEPGVRRQLFEDILKEFREISSITVPERFRTTITDADGNEVLGGNGEPQPFPNFRQKVTLHEFLKTKRKLLNGDTGATKTSCAYLAMEAEGAKKTTVFGPAMARNTWPNEAKLRFKPEENVKVYTVSSASQLDSEEIAQADYVYVSGQLLSTAWKRPELMEKLVDTLVTTRGTDGIILDESDEFRNKGASRSKTLLEIVRRVRDGSEQARGNKIPIVALTATPIATSLADLDTTMGILYPEKFSFPDEPQNGRTSFSKTVLNNPRIAYSILFGEQLMLQWTQKDMFKDVQEIDPEIVGLKLSPSQRAIYEWVKDNSKAEAMTKIQLLSSVLLNPELIKEHFYKYELAPEAMPREQQVQLLDEVYDEYLTWWDRTEDQLREPFSADWLAKHGHEDFVVQCFFDKNLVSGIDTLAESKSYIAQDWVKQTSVSAKYDYLRTMLQEKFAKNSEGQIIPSEKVFIVSPFLKKGFTRWLEDDHIKDSDLADNAFSLYEYIRTEWFEGLPPEMTVNIDGRKKFSKRDEAAREWREEGGRAAIVVATLKSVYESMNFAIQDTERNKNIDHATIVFLGWPWGWDDFKQMCGRFVRPGQAKRADYMILETEGTIDKGFEDLVYRKFLLTQMALAGIELTAEDQNFFDETNSAINILFREGVSGQTFIRNALSNSQGKGSSHFANSLIGQEGEWVQTYYDEGKDQFRQVGHNAELTKNILSQNNPQRLLSLGAGTCLVARKFQEAGTGTVVDNVDILGSLMHFAKDTFNLPGQTLVGSAADLSNLSDLDGSQVNILDETYDSIDCSFMLDLTSPIQDKETGEPAERVRVLSEINRALRMDGTAALSFHRGAFEDNTVESNGQQPYEEFRIFCKALEEHFGFEVTQELSGRTFATDMVPPRRIGWVITLRKVGQPNPQLADPNSLLLLSDNNVRISKFKDKRRTKQEIAIDYPVFSPKKFEIYNPITMDVSTADTEKITLTNPRTDVSPSNEDNPSTDAQQYQANGNRPYHPEGTESALALVEIASPRRFRAIIDRVSEQYTGGDAEAAREILRKVVDNNNLTSESSAWQTQNFPRLARMIAQLNGNGYAK